MHFQTCCTCNFRPAVQCAVHALSVLLYSALYKHFQTWCTHAGMQSCTFSSLKCCIIAVSCSLCWLGSTPAYCVWPVEAHAHELNVSCQNTLHCNMLCSEQYTPNSRVVVQSGMVFCCRLPSHRWGPAYQWVIRPTPTSTSPSMAPVTPPAWPAMVRMVSLALAVMAFQMASLQ